MGYSLYPRNKKLESMKFGAFSWSWMLDAGVGLPAGHMKGREPASFRYAPDKKGRCIMYNDGFRVDAFTAKAMAASARTVASAYRAINREWDELTPERRESQQRMPDIYRLGVREDFIEKAEKFAEWAEKSQGFGVY